MTPILGLDTLLEHKLSLSFGHDEQSFLVTTAGKRTQLTQQGEHQNLVAYPFQHGLSTCSRGSLPEVIGFLPEDKELHDQELALNLLQALILLRTKAFSNLCMFMKSLALFVCFAKMLLFQGESFQVIAFHPCSNNSQGIFQEKTISFTTAIPDQQSKDLRSFKKQKPELQRRRSHIYSRQLVCMIFQTELGMIHLWCAGVILHKASFQQRSLATRE